MFDIVLCVAYNAQILRYLHHLDSSISWTISGESWSEISDIEFKMDSNSICVSLVGRVVGLVHLSTQLILFQKHL